MDALNYKPADGWAGDFIPLFWEGEYHLFFLKDYRDVAGHGEGTPWFHLSTLDFLHFRELGEALPRGGMGDQDLYVFTGSILAAEGKFHIFYTGHNPHLRQAGRPEQGIMHAVSDDLLAWRKLPEHTFFAPAQGFEPHDWRDPFVFWNEEAGEYWMLIAARTTQGPSRRRGITGLCTSRDLATWTVREPFYAPAQFFTHECPDLFRIGDWWYLIFSEFSDACVTRYRMARSLGGPWLTPRRDTFDGRAYYAAKSASDGERRFLFGWNPTRQGEKDDGPWQWGGNLVVHELVQQPDGMLAVRIPEAVAAHFQHSTALPSQRIDASMGFWALALGDLPACARLDAVLRFSPETQACGLLLRMDADLEAGYYIRLEPQAGRLVFDSWPRPGDKPQMAELERLLALPPNAPVRLTLYVNGTLCEVYVNDEVAMSARMYDHKAGQWGLFATNGVVEFGEVRLAVP